MNKCNLIGKKFGRLTVVNVVGRDKVGKQVWLCKCDCGNELKVNTSSLNSGNTKSCGCIGREKTIERSTKHGLCRERVYKIWVMIRQRCNNESNNWYSRYGGRGIKICEEWDNDFMSFYNWSMENGYKKHLSIDRIDNDLGYYPENCRWADWEQQANNQKRIRQYTYKGVTDTITYLCERFGKRKGVVRNRLLRGYTIEEAMEMQLWGKRNE